MRPNRRTHVFVLIDALGWRLLENQEFLGDVLPYRAALRTVLGFSSGAIPTILTGRPPAQNGHWNLFYYDPKGSPFRWLRHFDFVPDHVVNHRITRKLLKEMGQHVFGLGPLFECSVSPRLMPWFNWIEKRTIYGRRGILGAPSIFDILAERCVPARVYTYRHLTDARILWRAKRDLKSNQADVFFLYLSELDHFLHDHCDEQAGVTKRLAWYDAELRNVFEVARDCDPQVSLSVFSDHGMTPVRNTYDAVQAIEALGFTMPKDYLAVYDSTMARFWFFSDEARSRIVDRLESFGCGRILADEELDRLGVFFPDRRYGEIIFLLDSGWLLTHSDFHGKGWVPKGMHGYHPDDPYSDAVFLTNRPPSVETRTIADIFPHMLEAVQ